MTFYKYTTTTTAEIVLKNQSLRWSSPLLFNDIEECQFTPFTEEQYLKAFSSYIKIVELCAKGCLVLDTRRFSYEALMLIELFKRCTERGETAPILSDFFLKNHRHIHHEYINKGLLNCFRILCVTTEYDNNLMWAYYADQHYGCVIELESVYKEKPYLLRESPVRYHDNIAPLSNPLDMFLYGETPEIKELMIKDIIFSKRSNWLHEKEYRFMFCENYGQISSQLDLRTNKFEVSTKYQSESSYTDVPITKESVKSVTFGARTPHNEIEKIINVVSSEGYDCKFYQMKLESGTVERKLLVVETNCS
ncbi:DUF2971 domain-containing protein [Pseudoalteromonas sp. SR45-1]|uniref:DUF2971 domain-containing protein n=1 Tax=Pseudoalteromonas TaxID=53246 RepID=UPI0016006B9E|nr:MULTISPECIES: DUF2971 domain-containing protein [Pseudoalteromonas]MBB1325664.1 DUF2971 domain-containing protein [Pseudoalteromonas sp. SR45-1]